MNPKYKTLIRILCLVMAGLMILGTAYIAIVSLLA